MYREETVWSQLWKLSKSKFSNGPQEKTTRAASRRTEGIQRPRAKQGSDSSKGFLYQLLEALRLQSEITPLSSDERGGSFTGRGTPAAPNSSSTACWIVIPTSQFFPSGRTSTQSFFQGAPHLDCQAQLLHKTPRSFSPAHLLFSPSYTQPLSPICCFSSVQCCVPFTCYPFPWNALLHFLLRIPFIFSFFPIFHNPLFVVS